MRGDRLVSALAAGLVVAAAAACAPLQVNTFEPPARDVSDYQTYAWRTSGGRATGDPRLDGHSPFESYVTATIDEQLRGRGLEPAVTGMDLIVHWTATTTQRVSRGVGRGRNACADCGLDVFDEGALVIDFVDAQTNGLVWRGWATGAFDDVAGDQPRLERRIHAAVSRILARLPRRLGASGPPL